MRLFAVAGLTGPLLGISGCGRTQPTLPAIAAPPLALLEAPRDDDSSQYGRGQPFDRGAEGGGIDDWRPGSGSGSLR